MLKLRLSMGGTKKRPVYKIVVADSRFPRDGRFIEKLGFFNPLLPKEKKERVGLQSERIKYWLSQGAKPTMRVARILGENQSKDLEKRILLQSIDFNWKSHIQYLEQLRQVVGLRSYGQRDPLIEYKKEAFDLFSNLLEKLKLDYVKILMNLKVFNEPTEKINQRQLKEKFKNLGKKTSRNDPCPCGSGKKFKKCCGAL